MNTNVIYDFKPLNYSFIQRSRLSFLFNKKRIQKHLCKKRAQRKKEMNQVNQDYKVKLIKWLKDVRERRLSNENSMQLYYTSIIKYKELIEMSCDLTKYMPENLQHLSTDEELKVIFDEG